MNCWCCWRRWRRRRWRNTSPADLNVFHHNIWLFLVPKWERLLTIDGDDVSFISFIRVVFIVVVLLFHGRDRTPSFSLLCVLKFHGLLKGWLPRSTRFSKRQNSRRSSSSCSFLSSSDYYGTHGRERRSGKFDTRGFSTTTRVPMLSTNGLDVIVNFFLFSLFFFFRKETKK